MENYFKYYEGKTGTIHTEFDLVAKRLEQHGVATRVEEIDIELYEGNRRKFIVLETTDLAKAYRIMRVGYMQAW